MKIKFNQDYRGVKTKIESGEAFFKEGDVIDTSAKGRELFDGEGLMAEGFANKVKVAKAKKAD